MPADVRLSAFAEITRHTRDMIRNRENKGDAPWRDAAPDGGQRRYNAFHGTALILSEMLTAQGVSLADAGVCVRTQEAALSAVFKAINEGRPEDRFVTAMYDCEEDPIAGPRWILTPYSLGAGTAEEIAAAVASSLGKVGQDLYMTSRYGPARRIGGPHLSVASVLEAYRLLKIRAKEAGYIVDGLDIHKIAKGEDEDAGSENSVQVDQ